MRLIGIIKDQDVIKWIAQAHSSLLPIEAVITSP
jgi:hypothetical protein